MGICKIFLHCPFSASVVQQRVMNKFIWSVFEGNLWRKILLFRVFWLILNYFRITKWKILEWKRKMTLFQHKRDMKLAEANSWSRQQMRQYSTIVDHSINPSFPFAYIPVLGPLLSAILIRETRLDSTPTEGSSTVEIWTANNTAEAYQRVTVLVQWLCHVTLLQAYHW